jgi:asparagine synthase (glutamine-hydrolysing)
MCGICGSTRDPEGSAVAAMNRRLRHRGPDDEGCHVDRESGVALGARRLSIIDVAGGHQPLSNEDGTLWAALNGEIYNHPALQQRLREKGHRLATGTDTEVLVHLYEEYGDALVHALEGMYAFALWDARRGRLLLARDRFGEKPLFYARRGGDLTFASELFALRAAGAAGDELDPDALDAYFVFGYVPGPGTIVRGVRQLPPGHVLTWERASRRCVVEPYWSPPPARSDVPSELPELIAETRSLLDSSVRSRMIADVPLGVFLSGGVDSSLIAAVAASASSGPVKTFTVGYDVGAVSETEPARAIAEEIGSDHRELVLTQEDVARRAPALLAGLDQPLADQALVALHGVAELARGEVTVAIGGEGADELFGGYPRYRWLARASRFGQVVPAALAGGAARALNAAPLGGRSRRLADVVLPQETTERHLDWVTDGRRHVRERLYGPALAERTSPADVLTNLDGRVDGHDGDVIARFMRLDQLHWLPDDVLMKADRASMQVSLEVRTPYLQRELAEFAASVPPKVHARHHGKSLLRALVGELIPRTGGRPKTAFRVPVADWLRGPLAPVASAQVRQGALYAEGWIDRAQAKLILDEHVTGSRDWSQVLWPLLALGLWLDAFRCDGAS